MPDAQFHSSRTTFRRLIFPQRDKLFCQPYVQTGRFYVLVWITLEKGFHRDIS
jgi:hypothetical protein